jgi:aspartate aminotransferase-like enzyme
VAAPGFEAPSVVVSYTDEPDIQNGARFAAQGMQIAAGVPLKCDEPEDFRTFRIGLFGLDKLRNVEGTVADLEKTLDVVLRRGWNAGAAQGRRGDGHDIERGTRPDRRGSAGGAGPAVRPAATRERLD